MTYEQIKNLSERQFKGFCGVKPQLFEEMIGILRQKVPESGKRGGQPKLSIEDQLLVAPEYWREYRTYFHIAQSWGVHESTVCRIVHRVEDQLIRSRKFSKPGKKSLFNLIAGLYNFGLDLAIA
ncbi:MAG: transposase family protein [Cyanobacteria bacterium J06621_8]